MELLHAGGLARSQVCEWFAVTGCEMVSEMKKNETKKLVMKSSVE